VAKRNTGRRGRSRKRRPASQPATSPAAPEEPRKQRSSPPRAAAKPGYRDPTSSGERPQSPWHPLPLSELLILVGAIGTIVGFRRTERGVLLAGIGAVALGTVEVTYREHMSGYRSHTILLAMIPTLVVFVGLSLLGAALATPVPTWLRVVPIVIVVPLFAGLFKLLRARFLDARRERTSAARR
jgi:hypothetical protein